MRKTKIDEIRGIYDPIKSKIQSRLEVFDKLWAEAGDKELFVELVFCLLTPQSNAYACWEDIQRLLRTGLMWSGNTNQIAAEIRGARFHKTKAGRIVDARNQFFGRSKGALKSSIEGFGTASETRD